MKAVAIALPLTLAAGVFIGVRAETPWFSAKAVDAVNYAGSFGPIVSGSSYVIATVPNGKHLVAFDFQIDTLTGDSNSWTLVQRDSTGTETVRVPARMYGSSLFMRKSVPGLGLVFEPGTDVVLKYDNPGGAAGSASFMLLGHLADK